MTWLLFSSRYGVITKESHGDWFAFPHCTVLIGVHVAHAAWSRHNEAGLHGRGSALCIVRFGACFPPAGRVGTSHFPSSSNTPGGWRLKRLSSSSSSSGQSLGNEKSWSGEQRAVEHPWLDSSTGWSAEEASSPAPLGLFMGAPSLVCLRSLSITSRA